VTALLIDLSEQKLYAYDDQHACSMGRPSCRLGLPANANPTGTVSDRQQVQRNNAGGPRLPASSPAVPNVMCLVGGGYP